MKKLNEFINKVGIYSISDLMTHYHNKTKGHFFSTDTMKFFNSRLSSGLFYSPKNETIYFISSEKYNDGSNRLYTVRSYNTVNGEIDTIGNFQQYPTIGKAKTEAKKIAKKLNQKAV